MEKLLDIINSRYSCRRFSDMPVEDEKLDYIKQCMQLSPSAVNKQPWKFRIVRSDEGRAKLQSCYSRNWFNYAPMYVLCSVVHDEEWVRDDGKRHGDIDVAIAVEHLCLAAAEQGLGTCWVCNFDAQRCHELFGMPANEEPTVIVPLGYSAVAERPARVRKSLDEIFIEEV